MRYINAVTQSYDYIVVGSGSAGSVMAARLSANPANHVLLIETGGKDNSIGIAMPAAMGLPLTSNKYNYKYFGESEHGGNKEGTYTPRGRVFGGSSSINGMNWVRGNKNDYDEWAKLGLQGWDYQSVLPHFKRAESFEDGENEFRGGEGPITVERSKADNALLRNFLESAAALGTSENPDHNAANQCGPHKTQRNIGNGRRMNTSYAYIRNHGATDNLHILLHTTVDKLVFQQNRCIGLEIQTRNKRSRIPVDSEIIIATGAINTPKLLMLSGIGEADYLSKLGIASVAHLPAVGNHLSDHTCLNLEFDIRRPNESAAAELSIPNRVKSGLEWLLFRKGLGTTNHFEAGGFFATDGNEDWPDIQLECIPMRADFGVDKISVQPGFQCFLSLQRPTSEGHLRLRSADPKDRPVFRFNYLSTPEDQTLAVNAIKYVQNMLSQGPIAKQLKEEATGLQEAHNDAEILNWARRTVESNYHPCGTARMGMDETSSVVDSQGRVHGMQNLRIVDASIIPKIPTANLNAPVIMMAEKIAYDILKQDKAAN